MSLKKFLKSFDSGQVMMEYFIILFILAAMTILGVSTLLSKTQENAQHFTNKAISKIAPKIPYED